MGDCRRDWLPYALTAREQEDYGAFKRALDTQRTARKIFKRIRFNAASMLKNDLFTAFKTTVVFLVLCGLVFPLVTGGDRTNRR